MQQQPLAISLDERALASIVRERYTVRSSLQRNVAHCKGLYSSFFRCTYVAHCRVQMYTQFIAEVCSFSQRYEYLAHCRELQLTAEVCSTSQRQVCSSLQRTLVQRSVVLRRGLQLTANVCSSLHRTVANCKSLQLTTELTAEDFSSEVCSFSYKVCSSLQRYVVLLFV